MAFSKQRLSDFLQGQTSFFEEGRVVKLASILNCSMDYIVHVTQACQPYFSTPVS